MAATPADIAAASRAAAVAGWADPAIAARYPSARDGLVSPAPGFFDSLADAQAMVNARGALIGTERRRFAVEVADVVWPTVSTGVPQVQLIDSEQAVSATFLAARVEIDLDTEATNYELFG
jgi:hypothetical protein